MINVLTICYNSTNFIENLCINIKKTCGVPFKVHIVDNGSTENEIHKLKKISLRYNAQILFRKQKNIKAPSRHHAEAIHFGIDFFSSDDLIAIVDCDSAFIKKNWGSDILNLIKDYDHVTCQRPANPIGCGAWFSAFTLNKVIDNNINFLPRLNEDGTDKKCPDRWDVGSDLIRISSWKPLIAHPKIKFQPKGHVWMLDDIPFIDHMGKSRIGNGYKEWKRWLGNQWRIFDS